jgi:hypothetical protein
VQAPEDGAQIEEYQDAFRRIEEAVEAGDSDLRSLGFWKLVARVKVEPRLATHWADEAGRIDRTAFELNVRPRFPVWFGNVILLAGTAMGAGAIMLATRTEEPTAAGISLAAAAGILSLSTHDLAHWLVGRLAGIRFTSYFVGGPFPPRPGIKTDYATYLRASPEERVLMHASGAVASKLAPFVALAFYPATEAPVWAAWTVLGIGGLQIVTDILFSTKSSDWKKVRRERKVARAQQSRAR